MAKDDAKSSDESRDVLKVLRAAVAGLTFPSEADKPVNAFLWKPTEGISENGGVVAQHPIGEAELRTMGNVPSGATVQTLSVDDFFAPVTDNQDWFGDEEKACAKRFGQLLDTLKEHLTDTAVFRVSGAHDDNSLTDAYVTGRTTQGEVAGVSTQLVET